jgi:hypothetical protein
VDGMLRFVVVPIAVMATALFSVAGSTVAAPATQVINAVPVGSNGQPINGYQETPSQGNVVNVSDCKSSPSAVAANIYYCSPSAAGAGTCWPSTSGSLLCVDNPWTKSLHRVTYDGALPPVQATATPDPFALELDDGTHCLFRNGGSWGGRADGYVGVYGCGESGNSNPAVLWLPSQGAGTCIDRSAPAWTVKVGELSTPDANLPPPETRVVKSVWFAAA